MRILLTGPQGSGKTTQAHILAEKLGLCVVRMGDILRERALVDDEMGRHLKARMDKGLLADNTLVANLLQEELSHPKCASGFVLDGFPRSSEQLETFDPKPEVVFYLILSDGEMEDRLLGRQRADDIPEAIQNRLKWFHEETEKVIEHYEREGKVVRIDASQPLEKVSEDILARLKDYES